MSWKAVLRAADAAMEHRGWVCRPESLGHAVEGRYLKDVGDGFAAIVHLDPGAGSSATVQEALTLGELVLGQGVELIVSASYLAAERVLEDQGYARSLVEISDPDWDIDAHMLSIDRLKLDELSILVTEAIAAAAAAAERFAVAHASPLAFVATLKHKLEDEWVSAGDFVAAPAVLAAAGLQAEARAEIDRARAEVGTSIPDAFWDHLDQLLNSGR